VFNIIQSQDDLTTLITLDEAKRQCRLLPSDTLDDDDLTHLIAVCTDLAQTYTHRLLTRGVIVAESSEYHRSIMLPWGNVDTIDEVLLDGEEYTDYEFSPVTQKLTIPDTYSHIRVTYQAGYTTIPPKVKQGILMMISTFFNTRDDLVPGMSFTEVPVNSRACLDSVRYYVQ